MWKLNKTFEMKYILNAILSLIALSSICVSIFKTTELSSKCTLFAIALSCIGAAFTQKKYRYIFAGIALILMAVFFYFIDDNVL